LTKNGIRILDGAALELAEPAGWAHSFRTHPSRRDSRCIDSLHPFPPLLNNRFNLLVPSRMQKNAEMSQHNGIVQIPRILTADGKLPREDGRHDYVYLSKLIAIPGRPFFRARPSSVSGPSAGPNRELLY